MSESVNVSVSPYQSDISPDQAEFIATIKYLDADKQLQTVELTALEPLIIINHINDALRNQAIDLRRIPEDTLPPLPDKADTKEEVPAGA